MLSAVSVAHCDQPVPSTHVAAHQGVSGLVAKSVIFRIAISRVNQPCVIWYHTVACSKKTLLFSEKPTFECYSATHWHLIHSATLYF